MTNMGELLLLAAIACSQSAQSQAAAQSQVTSPFKGHYRGWVGWFTPTQADIDSRGRIIAYVNGVRYDGEIGGGRIRFAWVRGRYKWNGRRLSDMGAPTFFVLVRD